MLNKTFLRNKVDRQIKINGQEFEFTRYEEDEFHQVSDEPSAIATLEGIFHTSNSYISQNTADGSKTFAKPTPMILTLYEQGNMIKTNDMVIIEGNNYKVIKTNNINDFNVAIDISLELMQDED